MNAYEHWPISSPTFEDFVANFDPRLTTYLDGLGAESGVQRGLALARLRGRLHRGRAVRHGANLRESGGRYDSEPLLERVGVRPAWKSAKWLRDRQFSPSSDFIKPARKNVRIASDRFGFGSGWSAIH